jgi:hypothetical protein
MKDLLNAISILSTFVTIAGIIYLLLDNTIGRVKQIARLHIRGAIALKHVLFVVVAVTSVCYLLFANIVTFYKPY